MEAVVAVSTDIDVRIDPRQVRELEQLFKNFPGEAKTALFRATSNTTRFSQAEITRQVRKVTTLKVKSIKRRVAVRVKAKRSNPTAAIEIHQKTKRGAGLMPLLTSFAGTRKPRKSKRYPQGRGITAKPRINKQREKWPHGFMITGRGGVPVPVRRETRDRYPLVPIRGPSPWGVIAYEKGVYQKLEKAIMKKYEKEIEKRIIAALRGKG